MPRLSPLPLSLRSLRRTFLGNRLGLMERLFGQRLRSRGICWVETSTGIPWKVDLDNPCHRWMVYGDYADPGFWKWARKHISEDGTVVDSGANIGQFVPYYANIVQEGCILAFEPSTYCGQWIHECLSVNPNLPVEVIPKGLSQEEGRFTLQHTEGAHGLWGELSESENAPGEGVEVTTLTDALRIRDISQVSLWKLDVEGHELKALRGAEDLLAEHRVDALYVELRAQNRQADVEYLRGHGYAGFEVKRNGMLERVEAHPEKSADLLFLPVKDA